MAPQMHYAVALREITNSLVKGMKLLASVGGGEGRGTKVVDKIGAPVSLLLVALFGFLRLGFLAGIFGNKKSGWELTCWTPYFQRLCHVPPSHRVPQQRG